MLIGRIEIWKLGSKLISYRTSNVGYRELKIVTKGTLTTLKKELKKLQEETEMYAEISFYQTLEERDHLEVF
jgi:hypothetical protein